jgi:hypothetical protein
LQRRTILGGARMNDASWTHSCTELSLGCLLKMDGPTPLKHLWYPCSWTVNLTLYKNSGLPYLKCAIHQCMPVGYAKKTLGSAPGKSTTFQFIQILASRDYITLLEQCNDNVATEDVSRSNLLSATCHTCQQYKEHH